MLTHSNYLHTGLLITLFFLTGCKATAPVTQIQDDKLPIQGIPAGYDSWDINTLNTASNATYISKIEREVVLELNLLRSNPQKYAELYLKPFRQYYHGKNLEIPGRITIITNEGIKPLDECISQLSRTQPAPALIPSQGMCKAARDHAEDQSKTGKTGHDGSDGSSLPDRLNRYGKWLTTIGENIDYGNGNAREIIIALLIDDGVSSRGHRKNLLNGAYHNIGVAVRSHPQYEYVCVMDYAGGFESK
ncbi:MAG TPA: CAP domain-containing protein [Cyclobacteriaceae bacterium]|nr:CAP domain-containing protein [Cyclobacteriaceae bacterium]